MTKENIVKAFTGNKDRLIFVRIQPELYKEFISKLEKEGISVSKFVRKCIIDYCFDLTNTIDM